ncbi:emerin-like isoform X3 [Salvelinus namaycush]|uniref:Emerin-like isoform X3 n=1 Tax=Salvelinus namaycush TaxID=8040 RepID=A0A8U1F0A7_SALNM|nr:emerin-like isoform X3 [Salvelinus namaycush]
MAALSNKSDQEIKDLLDEYGIKHGPVVDTTRPLYEKKLKEAMAKAKVTVTKPSPDRTFYREDQEEVTYVTCQTPVRSEGPSGDGKPYMRSRPEYSERDRVDDKPYSRPEYSERNRVDDKPYSRPEYSERNRVDDKPYSRPEYSEIDRVDDKPYSRSKLEYRERDRVDDKPYSRSKPEYRERDRVDDKLYSRSRPEYSSGRQYIDEPHVYNTPSSSSSYSKPTPVMKSGGVVKKENTTSSGRLIPLWIQFLVFLIVAGFLYFIFTNMESAESSPFNKIQ